MDWILDHAPQIAGSVLFLSIVYLLIEEMMTRRNND